MRVTEAESYTERRNSIAYEYVEFLESLGFLVILTPNNSNAIERYFDIEQIDLVVLSGGNNVDPDIYGADVNLDDVYTERDETEKELFNIAIKKRIKILGICRGFQAMNVFLGGSLSHGIGGHVNQNHKLVSSIDILNHRTTNSFHNQAIKEHDLYDLSQINILAKSEDGLVEAITNFERTILGVQWHPERQKQDFDKELIRNFINGKL
jgi:putative glutamine amidotransferase